MSMISDLADRLRVESKSMGKYGVDYMATLLMQASDTIIMLSEKARADRPQGKWIDVGSWMGLECSRCKCHSRYVTPFCPQCGARMKGADDE